MKAITEREVRLRAITEKMLEPGPDSFEEKLERLRDSAVGKLERLREALTNPGAIHEAKGLLAEQVGKFTLKREERAGKFSLGSMEQLICLRTKMALHGRVVPGARIELATPAFSGRRSTNELPRLSCVHQLF
jgi:hypothetical protein